MWAWPASMWRWPCSHCKRRMIINVNWMISEDAEYLENHTTNANSFYTASQNKTPTQPFCDNFSKYGPILIILSPLLFCHELQKKLLYNLPPHLKSVATLPCEIRMFNWTTIHYSHSIIQKCAKSFIFSKYLQECHDLDDMSMPIHLQSYSMCSKYPPSACRHACTPLVNGCVNDALFNAEPSV